MSSYPIVHKYIYCYSLSESDSSAAALASRALAMSFDASLVSALSLVPENCVSAKRMKWGKLRTDEGIDRFLRALLQRDKLLVEISLQIPIHAFWSNVHKILGNTGSD